jgi:hypothetical protein
LDDYKKTLRLSLRQDRGAVESLLKHLQIKLGTYGLRGYEAPRELGEEAILDKWDELVEAEKIRSEMIARGINAWVSSRGKESGTDACSIGSNLSI